MFNFALRWGISSHPVCKMKQNHSQICAILLKIFSLQFCMVTSPHCPNLEFRIKIIKDVSQSNLNSGFFRQTPGTLMQAEVDNEEIRKYLNFIRNLMQFPVPLSFCLTLSTEDMGQQPCSSVQMLSFKLFLWHASQSFCNRFSRREVLTWPQWHQCKDCTHLPPTAQT